MSAQGRYGQTQQAEISLATLVNFCLDLDHIAEWYLRVSLFTHWVAGIMDYEHGRESEFSGWDFCKVRCCCHKEALSQQELTSNYFNQWQHYQTYLGRSSAEQILFKELLVSQRKPPTAFYWRSLLPIYYLRIYFPTIVYRWRYLHGRSIVFL